MEEVYAAAQQALPSFENLVRTIAVHAGLDPDATSMVDGEPLAIEQT